MMLLCNWNLIDLMIPILPVLSLFEFLGNEIFLENLLILVFCHEMAEFVFIFAE